MCLPPHIELGQICVLWDPRTLKSGVRMEMESGGRLGNMLSTISSVRHESRSTERDNSEHLRVQSCQIPTTVASKTEDQRQTKQKDYDKYPLTNFWLPRGGPNNISIALKQ